MSHELDALVDSRRVGTPVVTWAFLGLCWAVTVPSLAYPSLYGIFGGIEPRAYPWQLFTAVLEHGWPGFPGAVHLLLNTFLVLECGRPCERLLGSARFLGLCLASASANAVAQLYTGGANGSSLVIWSWGPPLFVALLWARRRANAAEGPGASRIRGALIVMYVVVIAAMGLLPYAGGWRGNPVVALLLGNVYHLVATAVGTLAALVWRQRIHGRLEEVVG